MDIIVNGKKSQNRKYAQEMKACVFTSADLHAYTQLQYAYAYVFSSI